MTQLYIPPLRVKFTLSKDWTFPLYCETRNMVFAKFMKVTFKEKDDKGRWLWASDIAPVRVTIPAGTEMYIDRYYIKNGATAYDSVTFRAKITGSKTLQRFWAKLGDTNGIEVEFQPSTV